MRKNKKLLLIVISIIAISVALIGNAFADNGTNEPVFQGEEIASEYGYFSEFVAPIRYIRADGKEYVAKSVITFPSGKATSYGRAVLDEIGEYSIDYEVEVDGNSYTESHAFSVSIAPKDLWTGDTTQFKTYNNADVNPVDGKGAVLLSAYTRTEIRYLNELYLADNTLAEDVITFVIKPQQRGNAEQREFYIVIEDAENASNRIYVKFRRKSYEIAKEKKSMEVSVSINDTHYTAEATIEKSSMCGINTSNEDSLPVTISLDAKNRMIAVTCDSTVHKFDLKQPITVGSADVWEGFSGKWAYVYAGFRRRLTNGASSVAVYSVDGISLGGDTVSGECTPRVSIESDKMTSGILYGVEGGKHVFPEARAICPVEGEINIKRINVYEVKKGVLNNVYSGMEGFVPQKTGEYRVEYVTEENCFGVSGNAFYKLIVLDEDECAIDFEFGSFNGNYVAGSDIAIPEYFVSGGKGKISVDYEVSIAGKSVDVYNGVFFAEAYGEYEIKAVCRDDLQVKEFIKKVTVSENTKKYIDVSLIPTTVVLGETVDLSLIDAYEYTESGKSALTKTVKVNGKSVSGKYVFDKVGSNSVSVVTGSEEKTFSINVVSPDSSKYPGAFFATSSATYELEKSSLTFAFSKDEEISFIRPIGKDVFYFEFVARKEEANFESVSLTLTDSLNSSNKLSFTLTKKDDSTPRVSILTYQGKNYEVNGGWVNKIGQYPFKFAYDNQTRTLFDVITDGQKEILTFDKTASGREFVGFEGDIYLSLKINGVSASSELLIKKIANQEFKSGVTDTKNNAGPAVSFNNALAGGFVGEEYTLSEPNVYDVFESVGDVTVTIKDGDGAVVTSSTSLAGIKFTPEKEGDYIAVYEVKDSKGNLTTKEFSISVKDKDSSNLAVGGVGVITSDKDAPVITIGSKPATTAKVNEKFSLAKISVKDTLTASSDIKLYVYVIAPDGVRTLICCTPTKITIGDKLTDEQKRDMITNPESEYLEFTAKSAGVYRVYYVATDGNDLTTIEHYNVVISND